MGRDLRKKLIIYRKDFRKFVIIIIGALGVAISLFMFFVARGWEDIRVRGQFERDADIRVSAIKDAISRNMADVDALKAFYEGSEKVERDEFRQFTKHLLDRNPGIKALEWVPRVMRSERGSFESRARQEGYAGYSFTERGSNGEIVQASIRNEYYPVYYLEPLVGNEPAFGFDLASNPRRLAALEKARMLGAPVVSERIRLVQETRGQFGFLLIQPIYVQDKVKGYLAGGKPDIEGYVVGVYGVRDIVEAALEDIKPSSIDLFVYDKDDPNGKVMLHVYYSNPDNRENISVGESVKTKSRIFYEMTVKVADHEWSVIAIPSKGYKAEKKLFQPWLILITGLLFTGFIIGFVAISLVRAEESNKFALEMKGANEELAREIDERLMAENILREERDRVQKYLDVAKVIFVVINEYQEVILINKKGCEILGYSEEEIIGKNWFDQFLPPDKGPSIKNIYVQLMEGRVKPVEYFESAVLTKEGDERMIAWHSTALTDNKGNITGTLSSGEDITEKRHLETQLNQAQKMEAVGRLAGGIAHDFNNILTAIVGYAEIIRMKMGKEDPLYSRIESVLASCNKASNLTKGLLAFSRKQAIEPDVVDLNEIVLGIEGILVRVIGEDINMSANLVEGKADIMADRSQIEQVLMNLAVNARDEMPDGGELKIETDIVVVGNEELATTGVRVAGTYVILKVSDTGRGMDETTTGKVFEPFFTTKEVGNGTGLGLSMVYGIVQQHNGSIIVDSELGKGTEFKIYLPMSEQESAADVSEMLSAPVGGNETVLIAEDDDAVRELTEEILTDRGYKVIKSVDGNDAIKKFNENKKIIDIALLDVMMPGKDGKAVYDEIRNINPEIKVLFMSGYDEDLMQRKGIFKEDVSYLIKPVVPSVLLAELRKVLDSK